MRKDLRLKDDNIKGMIEEELYDVLYYVLALANIYNINLEESIRLKEKLTKRNIVIRNILETINQLIARSLDNTELK